MRIATIIAVAGSLLTAALAAPAQAQDRSALAAARSAGVVGERYDGYLGIVTAASEAVRRQVGAVNLRRRSLYIGLATRRNVMPQVVGLATGCELLSRVRVGEYYMLADGAWRRRQPGQAVPLPRYCRG